MTDAVAKLWEALRLPRATYVDRWVPKNKLAEGGGLSSADRRTVEAGVERLQWRATLRPSSIGIPASVDEKRPCAEIVVMTATLKTDAKVSAVAEIIQRAVSAPLILLLGGEEDGRLSAGLQRKHERESGRIVLERHAISPLVGTAGDDPIEAAFLASLDIGATGAIDLWQLHADLADRAEAYAAARETGVFRLASDESQTARRREALRQLEVQRREVSRLRGLALREKRLAARVELSREVGLAEAQVSDTLKLLF